MSDHDCEQWAASPAQDLSARVDRRSVLKFAAVALATIGLAAPAQAAMAASTKVKACKTSAVPVRGMKAFTVKGQSVLITQPKKGTFRVFSSVCTHAGGAVNSLSGTNLVCSVHGSRFDTTTGKPTSGPAMTGLKKYTVSVKNGFLYITV